MKTSKIRKMIENAVAKEKDTGNLADLLHQLAHNRCARPNAKEIQGVAMFIQEYIKHVPALIEVLDASAKKAGIVNQVKPVLEAVEQYFFSQQDIIPDHLGLVGLLDDAYLAHSLIQGVSDQYQQQTGQLLLSISMTETNRIIRGLIGEPHASMLDTKVASTLGLPGIQGVLQQLMNYGFTLPMPSSGDPIWGNASVEEIARARLGAMGVV